MNECSPKISSNGKNGEKIQPNGNSIDWNCENISLWTSINNLTQECIAWRTRLNFRQNGNQRSIEMKLWNTWYYKISIVKKLPLQNTLLGWHNYSNSKISVQIYIKKKPRSLYELFCLADLVEVALISSTATDLANKAVEILVHTTISMVKGWPNPKWEGTHF